MLIGLHMIMEQIIDLRDDVRQKQTLRRQKKAVLGREKAKGAPLDKAKQAWVKAKKDLTAGKKKPTAAQKKKGKQPTTEVELKELMTKVNDTYRMWQWYMCGQDYVKKAADIFESQLDESLQNCRISVRPGSAVWFGKVRTSSAMTTDRLHGGRCMKIGLSDKMLPDAALATAEFESWRALGVDDRVEEVKPWTPHPKANADEGGKGESKSEKMLGKDKNNNDGLRTWDRSRVWSDGCASFPDNKRFLDGLIGTGKEVWVDEKDKSQGIKIHMSFESDRINKVFDRKDMKDELKENGDEYYYVTFPPEHIQVIHGVPREGNILHDHGDGTFNVLWDGGDGTEGGVQVSRARIALKTSKNSGDKRMPETTRQWLQYCETAYNASTEVQGDGETKGEDQEIQGDGETKGEGSSLFKKTARQVQNANTFTRKDKSVRSLFKNRSRLLQHFNTFTHKDKKSEQATEVRQETDKFADHEWRSPLFWLMRGLRYHRNEMFKTKEQYLDLFRFVLWWLRALSGIDDIVDLEEDTKHAMQNLGDDCDERAMYQVLVDTSLAQAWRAVESKNFTRLKEIFSDFPSGEGSGAPPNADPLIQHLLQTRIGQGETWLKDRNRRGPYDQFCLSNGDGPNTELQRRKWYRVGESFMRGNAFHLAVLVGDPEIFAFLLNKLRAYIVKFEKTRLVVKDDAGGEEDDRKREDDGESKGDDMKVDDMRKAFVAVAVAAGASSEAAAAAAAAATAEIGKSSGSSSSSSSSAECELDEGTRHSITSSLYDAEIAQMCLHMLDAHGRSETRCAIGRYNVLQTAAAFTKHKKAPLLCGLLRHIEDMHSKPSKLVRRIDSHKRESDRARHARERERVNLRCVAYHVSLIPLRFFVL